uniref:Neur_chan_LBD domain-containing protein n=1 Tax=Steinernema glaseri TaxID=37863 RepID=A0A1I7ZPU6_9BILA
MLRNVILTAAVLFSACGLALGRRANGSDGTLTVHISFVPTLLHNVDTSTKSLQLTADVVFVHWAGKKNFDPVPGVAFRNALFKENDAHSSASISFDGTTRVEKSYKADIYCDIRYSLYPFERPLCSLQITTVNATASELKLGWMVEQPNRAVLEIKEVGDYEVQSIEKDYCTLQRPIANTRSSTVFAKFPCLSWRVQLARPLSISLISLFIPSVCLVMLTWTVQYIDRERPTMRLLVCSLAACGIVFVIEVANRRRPPAASVGATDVWTVICLAFLGLCFLEIILCHMMSKESRKQRDMAHNGSVRVESRQRRERLLIHHNSLSKSVSKTHLNGKSFDQSKNSKEPSKSEPVSNYDILVERHFIKRSDFWSVMAVRTDLAARVLNPLFFIITVALYFVFYTVV